MERPGLGHIEKTPLQRGSCKMAGYMSQQEALSHIEMKVSKCSQSFLITMLKTILIGLFGQGEWTCSITIFTGTHLAPMKEMRQNDTAYKEKIPSRLCTVAHWKYGEIVEENLLRPNRNYVELGLA